MVKVDIISGFLGAGKTTLIKKLFSSSFKNEKVALIENEFGEIGIDGAFLKDTGINIKEINSGCICCSLSGNFKEALLELINTYELDRIIIEPSGVGKLSEVVSAVKEVEGVKVNVLCTVVDGNKVKLYHKNFGEFYIDQIANANSIVLSKIEGFSEEKLISVCEYIKSFNPIATIITTPLKELDGSVLLENLEDGETLTSFIINLLKQNPENHHHHEHHHDHHDCDCEHEHHHDHHDCDCEHEHHHDHHDCDCEHEHHHDHHDCDCEHEHHHEHHGHGCCHHHDADEVFDSFYLTTPKAFTEQNLQSILNELNSNCYGEVLRAKGIVNGEGGWLEFDFVPSIIEIRKGSPDISGKICVIGVKLNKKKLEELFGN